MPKPTFFQAVLNKPSRSYATSNGPSPWSDDYEYHSPSLNQGPSRLYASPTSPSSSVVHSNRRSLAYDDRSSQYTGIEEHAGRRRTVSATAAMTTGTVASSPGRASSTRSKKASGSRDPSQTASRPRHSLPVDLEQPSAPVRTKSKKKVATTIDDTPSIASTSRQSTIKAKPKSKPSSDVSSAVPLSPRLPPAVDRRRRVVSDSQPIVSMRMTTAIEQAIVQPAGLLTPPQSDMSSETRASTPSDLRLTTPDAPPPIAIITTKLEKTQLATARGLRNPTERGKSQPTRPVDDTDVSDDDVFYTPRNSLSSSTVDLVVPSIQPGGLALPLFNLQPPTPAPIADPDESPFQSEPTSSASSLRPTPLSETPPLLPAKSHAAPIIDDAHTVISEAGSDDELPPPDARRSQGKQSRQTSFSVPSNRSPSRNPITISGSRTESVADSNGQPRTRPSSRHSSRKGSRNSFDDFVVHRRPSIAPSEVSAGGYAASIRSAPSSGYGKGGWAAAAATKSVTPVMYMPTDGSDGWAGFQASVPAPPPRQSRFTPLPSASLPPTFDRLVNGYTGSDSASNSFSGGLRVPSVDSSPSEYSQASDIKPSRSYIKRDHYQPGDDWSESGRQSSAAAETNDGDEWRQQQRRLPPLPAPSQYSEPPAPPHRSMSPRPASAMSLSRLEGLARSPPTSPRSSSYGTVPRPMSPYDEAVTALADRVGLERPSFLNPDVLTFLPEMTEHDSNNLYRPILRSKSRNDVVDPARTRRPRSVLGSIARYARSDVSAGREDDEDEPRVRRSKSAMGHHSSGASNWESGSCGAGVLMESHGREEHATGYTNLILPKGAYNPIKPSKTVSDLNPHVLGLPHSTMASICLSTSFRQSSSSPTPLHLRRQNGPPVDFSSHLKPPTKVGDSQILVQVYAVAIDRVDVEALEEKGKGDVGKWVPGRSFVGRCLAVGVEEKDIVRGDLVMGLVDVRKSGALSEYILCDRRRLSRAPSPTELNLEQLSLLPLQGITALRVVQSRLIRGTRALIMDAHTGISALVCQAMSRAGVHVTAVIPGGDDHLHAQTMCMAYGAKGVLTGSAAAVILNLEEESFNFVLDTQGGQNVYNAARRALKEGGRLVSLCRPDPSMVTAPVITHKPSSGLKSLRAAFNSKRKDSKFIGFEYIEPAGCGEPEVDSSGLDRRDVLEEQNMSVFRPVVDAASVVPFEKGAEAFRSLYSPVEGVMGVKQKVSVVRLIH